MEITKIEDWLVDYYGKYPCCISGHKSFAEKFGLVNETATLLFFANKKGIYGYIIAIGMDIIDTSKIEKDKAIDIKERLERIFNSKIGVVIYDNKCNFTVTSDFQTFDDNVDLKKYFQRINPMLIKDVGTDKVINKSVNNAFHDWVRKNITKYVVVSDIDMVTLGKNPIFFELRRTNNEPLETWEPYLNEKNTFRAQLQICNKNNLKYGLVAYTENREDAIAYHEIKPYKDKIEGKKFIGNKRSEVFKTGITDVFENYTSKRIKE